MNERLLQDAASGSGLPAGFTQEAGIFGFPAGYDDVVTENAIAESNASTLTIDAAAPAC